MRITVSNRSPSVTAPALRKLFAPYGLWVVHIMMNPMSGGSQGYGSVAMPDRQAAQAPSRPPRRALAAGPSRPRRPARSPAGGLEPVLVVSSRTSSRAWDRGVGT